MRVCLVVLVAVASLAPAFINADLTPQKLEKDAVPICTVKPGDRVADDRGANLTVGAVLKGRDLPRC